ncbi:hypothetical protein [Tumebacillus permanentifrigoris]|uniref:hypothetical protein n=1 Tax=Tumebacillus permanentifrigoris TaxID=378543 RepID=UPI0014729667|nr:hypothetical protein [Tumebacillus permanentifrigoris]
MWIKKKRQPLGAFNGSDDASRTPHRYAILDELLTRTSRRKKTPCPSLEMGTVSFY